MDGNSEMQQRADKRPLTRGEVEKEAKKRAMEEQLRQDTKRRRIAFKPRTFIGLNDVLVAKNAPKIKTDQEGVVAVNVKVDEQVDTTGSNPDAFVSDLQFANFNYQHEEEGDLVFLEDVTELRRQNEILKRQLTEKTVEVFHHQDITPQTSPSASTADLQYANVHCHNEDVGNGEINLSQEEVDISEVENITIFQQTEVLNLGNQLTGFQAEVTKFNDAFQQQTQAQCIQFQKKTEALVNQLRVLVNDNENARKQERETINKLRQEVETLQKQMKEQRDKFHQENNFLTKMKEIAKENEAAGKRDKEALEKRMQLQIDNLRRENEILLEEILRLRKSDSETGNDVPLNNNSDSRAQMDTAETSTQTCGPAPVNAGTKVSCKIYTDSGEVNNSKLPNFMSSNDNSGQGSEQEDKPAATRNDDAILSQRVGNPTNEKAQDVPINFEWKKQFVDVLVETHDCDLEAANSYITHTGQLNLVSAENALHTMRRPEEITIINSKRRFSDQSNQCKFKCEVSCPTFSKTVYSYRQEVAIEECCRLFLEEMQRKYPTLIIPFYVVSPALYIDPRIMTVLAVSKASPGKFHTERVVRHYSDKRESRVFYKTTLTLEAFDKQNKPIKTHGVSPLYLYAKLLATKEAYRIRVGSDYANTLFQTFAPPGDFYFPRENGTKVLPQSTSF